MLTTKSVALSAALILAATQSFAHATLETREAMIGAPYKGILRIPHGCDKQATNTVQIDLPVEIVAVKPMPKFGWTLETKIGPYATAFNNHGKEMHLDSGAHGPNFFMWRERFADYDMHLKQWYGQKRWFLHQDFTKC